MRPPLRVQPEPAWLGTRPQAAADGTVSATVGVSVLKTSATHFTHLTRTAASVWAVYQLPLSKLTPQASDEPDRLSVQNSVLIPD